MKGCFLLQRRFAYVGHAMVKTFKKKYKVDEFCGYVQIRSSFNWLKSQKDINYTNLLLDEDVIKHYKNEKIDPPYLEYLEKEFGLPNLWPYVAVDRVIKFNMYLREYPYDRPKYSHEDMIKMVQAASRFIIKFLEKEKPDFIIAPAALGGIGGMLFYHIAAKMGIKTFLIHSSVRIKTRCAIGKDYNGLNYIEEAFEKINNGAAVEPAIKQEAETFLKDFRKNTRPHSALDSVDARPINRRRQFKFLKLNKIGQSVKWTIGVFIDYIRDKNKDDYLTVKPWYYLWDKLKRKTRVLIGFNDFYDEFNEKDEYAFYPLQLDPEAASMMLAPFYTDQLWLIKQIARSLPINYKLYIKEHPAMFGYRPRCFYKELKKIPNVKIVKPSLSSFDLIKNAKLIATITGTAGWEAMLMKKPIITFGNVFYNKLSMAKQCKTMEDLPYLVKNQIENFRYDEKELINFITAIFQESAEVDLTQIWDIEGGSKMEKKEQKLVPLVDLIAKKLDLNPAF